MSTALPMFLLASPNDMRKILSKSERTKCRDQPSMHPFLRKWNRSTTIAASEPSPVPTAQPAAPKTMVSGTDRRQFPSSCAR